MDNFYNYYEKVQRVQTDFKTKKKKTEIFELIHPKVEIEDNEYPTAIELKKETKVNLENKEYVEDLSIMDVVFKDESIDFSDGPNDCFERKETEQNSSGDGESKKQKYKELSDKINGFFNFSCNKCKLDLGNPFGYQLHMKRKHKALNVTITCCGLKVPSTRTDLLYHYYTHTNIEAILCRFCGKQCKSMVYLRKHEQNHVEKLTKKSQIPCPDCGKQMQNKGSLRNHLINFHTPQDQRRRFECDLCKKITCNKTSLLYHFRVQHKMGSEPKKKAVQEAVLCPVCAKSFRTDAGFKCHFKAHHDIQKVICPECGREINKLSLKNHMKRLHDHEAQQCDICLKQFKNMHAVLHHKNRVHIAPRHECDLCEKKFKTKDKLKDHRRGHFIENRFHCDMCNVTCNDYSNILKHRKQVHQAPPLPKGMGRKILEIGSFH